MGAADDNIRSEHWYELAAAIAGLRKIPRLSSYMNRLCEPRQISENRFN